MTGELIVILCVVLILFGGKKLPEFARSLGLGIREFKKACSGIDEELKTEEILPLEDQKPKSKTCGHCGCASKDEPPQS